jgi:hypothetical protein
MVNDKKTKNDYINEIYKIIGGSPTDTFYDLKMSSAERGVLLRAAGLWDDAHHRARKLRDWTTADQKRIKEAAKKASQWAKGLQVAL